MLCCVSRKASTSSNNQNNENHRNRQNKQKSILDSVPSSSSSGFSSSSFASSDNFDSSITSGFTSSSSSPSDTSGFSSASSPITPVFVNSSSDSFSTVSQLADNFVESSDFLANNSSIIHTNAQSSSNPKAFSLQTPKRLQTFSSSPVNHFNDTVSEDSILGNESTIKDEPLELLPCTICSRTFKPQSLEKHTKICERAAIKKRKPFDSAKQRIQGTELAEFVPKETIKRKVYQPEEKIVTSTNKGSWKQTHDEFVQAIRAARGESIESPPQRQVVPANNVTVGVPTRPNEKGMCPTCNRQFSIKSYERHVAWCKERAGRVPMSAATNIAKERLEARMSYRAPALKNRRVTNREKYSPLSAMNLPSFTSKTNNPTSPNQRAKETVSSPNCNNKNGNENTMGNSQSQKSTINTKRSGQNKEGLSSGPMKSRLSDRSSRPSGEIEAGTTTSNCPSSRQNSSRSNNNVFHRLSRLSPTRTNISKSSNSPMSTSRSNRKNENTTNIFDDIDESGENMKEQESQRTKEIVRGSTKNRRQRQNIVHTRSHGNPKVNDVTINKDVIGLTVQPCVRKNIGNAKEEFITWKKIGENNLKNIEYLKFHSVVNSKCNNEPVKFDLIENENLIIDDKFDYDKDANVEMENISWANGIEKLDQTYLIKESLDAEMDFMDILARNKRRPVICSPRVEFCYDKKKNDNNLFGTHEITRANKFQCEISGENSKWWNSERKKEDEIKFMRKLSDTTSPSISGRLKLEPLNLTMIENEETPDFIETLRSEQSAKSLRETSRRKLTKNTKKLKPILGNESTRIELPNFESCEEKNWELLKSIKIVDNVDLQKNDKLENMKILETSRSWKSTTSLRKSRRKLLRQTSESIIGNESISRESLNLETYDEKNRERQFSDVPVDTNNDENINILDSSRSTKSATSLKIDREQLSMNKMESTVIGNESIGRKPMNFGGTCDEINREKLFSDITDHKINHDENIIIFDTSSSLKSAKNDDDELITKKLKKIESINEKKSFFNESLNFGACNETNCKKKSSDVKIHNDEKIEFLNTSRSLRGAIASKINCEELIRKKMPEMQSIVVNPNFGAYGEKNRPLFTNEKSSQNVDLKIDNDEYRQFLYTSRSFGSSSFARNGHDSSKNKTIQSVNDNQSKTNEVLDDTLHEIEKQEKSTISDVLARALSSPVIQGKKKTNDENIEIVENELNSGNEKSVESLLEKHDETPVEPENFVTETESEVKINYQRCGTYVIDKTTNSNVTKKHQTFDDFFDEKPVRKKRKTEKTVSNKKLKKSSRSENSMEKNSIPADGKKEQNLINFDEDLVIDPKKSAKNVEPTNELDIDKNENVREISEKYINQRFNYESDETLIDENLFKDCEFENSLKMEGKLSSGTETSIYEIPVKAFSDSYVMTEKISFDSFFFKEPKQPEVFNFSEIGEKSSDNNCIDISILRDFEKPEVQNFIEMGRKSREKNSLDNSFLIEYEKPEVRNSIEMRRKSREKNSLENSFTTEQEKPEMQGSLEIRRKLREKMKLLRGSTNNLIKSIETSGNVTKDGNASSNLASFESRLTREIEEETIREIDFGSVEKMAESRTDFCGFLPQIPIDRIINKNDNTKIEKKIVPLDESSLFWQKAAKNSNARLINLDPPKFHRETKIPCAKLSNVGYLPPVVPFGKEKRRISDRDSRPIWNNYVRRHPDFNLVLTGRTGSCKDYDPFLIAERQMNDLLSDTCSDQSLTDSSLHRQRSSSPSLPNYPLSHSSAFVKYPDPVTTQNPKLPEKRVSLIAPPTEFDDLATDFSSDSTETNSISREINGDSGKNSRARENSHENERKKNSGDHILGRRVIIDKSKALLGTNETIEKSSSNFGNSQTNEKARKILEKTSPKISRSQVNRSNSVRVVSVPKVHERMSNNSINFSSNKNNAIHNRNNNYSSLSGSNVSLSSIVSSDIEIKRSNSMFDEIGSSFEDDVSGIYPSLRSLLKNDSLSVTSPVQSNRGRNGQISDEEFSSPDSYKRQDHNKLSADSAYSSLNRKYYNHGRSTNDMAGRHEEDSPLRRRDGDSINTSVARSKMSKFCHECGSKFPDTAKFCCECGIRRLAL